MSNDINYEIDIRFPDQSPHRVSIADKLSIGSSSKSDLCIEDYNLSPLHLSFRTHNGVLSIHNLGGQNTTTLGKQELLHGKMYILNIGDSLQLGDIEIFIREGEAQDETPVELKELFENKTTPDTESEELIPYDESTSSEETDDINSEIESEQEDKPFEFQSMDELISDEEEEEEVESKTLIEKLTGIFKVHKKDLQEDIIKNNKNISISKVAPGFFVRLFSFISLVSVSYTVVDQIFPILELDQYFEIHIKKFQDLIAKIPYTHYLSSQIIKVIIVYMLLELTTACLLGINIGYVLLGVRNYDNTISKRIKGLLRSLIGFVTTPFIIFDLPCIIKKRTLKEFVTGSKLHVPSRFLQLIGFFLFTPVMLLSPLYTPILLNLERFKAIEVIEQQKVKFSKKEQVVKKEWSSATMKMNFSGKVSKKLIVLPAIKMNKNNLSSSIKINSVKNLNSWTNISYLEEIKLINKLRPLIKQNPMFTIHYPELLSELTSEKENNILTTLAFDQLFQLLKRSSNLDPLNIQDIFINHGPFLKDLLGINKLLTENLNIQNGDSVSIFKNNDKILIGNTNRSSNSIRTKYLIIKRNLISTNFRVSVPKKYFRYTTKMVENFFQNSTAYKIRKKGKMFNWADVLDTLTSIVETKKDITDSELAKIYEYYFEYTRSFLIQLESQKENDKDVIVKNLVSEIENTREYLESTLEFNNLQKVSELNISLKRLSENFENQNLNFFSINK